MNWLVRYGYSDCVFCDIVEHKPWEPARYEYEDEQVVIFHNVLGWVPVMLLAVPRGRIIEAAGAARHYHQQDLWQHMGSVGAVAMAMGRAHCSFRAAPSFRLVCNIGPLAMQSQQHAHIHILGSEFQPAYPDLRCSGSLVFEDEELQGFAGRIDSPVGRGPLSAVMVVPRERLTQDEFFAGMDRFGSRVLRIAGENMGDSYRLLAEVGPHAPLPGDAAHLYILGGGSLGHYV